MPWSYYWTSYDLWERRPARWAEDTRLAPRWTFHNEERVIALAVPSGKPAVPAFVRDVHLCSSDSACLLRWVEDALKVNSSAIWQDWRIESYFWTLWSRCITYHAKVDLSYVRDAVRSSSHGTAVDFIRPLSAIYSGPDQLAPSRLSSALDNNDLRGMQTYGPLCLALLPRVDDCYERYLEWIHRELVFRALGLGNDPGVGDAVAVYATLNDWWELLQDSTDRFVKDGLIESLASPSSPTWTRPSINLGENVSRTPLSEVDCTEGDNGAPSRSTPAPSARPRIYSEHNQGVPLSPSRRREVKPLLQEDEGSRNDPPGPSSRRRSTRPRVVVSEENPPVSPRHTPRVMDGSAPQLSPSPSRPRRPSLTPTVDRVSSERNAALLLNAEVFYAADCLYAVNVLTRLYEGHVLPADANDPYLPAAIKVITAQGSDAELVLLSWQRDLRIRRQLRANAQTRDLVCPAMGVVYGIGGYPDFVSPWSSQGSLTRCMGRQVSAGDAAFAREEVLDVIIELLRVVSALHEMGIVHGNLKGNNFLVTENGEIQLCDFGAYRTEEESQSVPSSIIHDEHEVTMHKSGFYMSPELRHSARPSLHSDMWAVSCVCLELFSAVYGDSTALESVALQCHSQLWPLRPKYIAKPVWDVLAANWRLEPSQRLSASEMHSRLTSIRVGMGVRWQ